LRTGLRVLALLDEGLRGVEQVDGRGAGRGVAGVGASRRRIQDQGSEQRTDTSLPNPAPEIRRLHSRPPKSIFFAGGAGGAAGSALGGAGAGAAAAGTGGAGTAGACTVAA